jgi:hypothetical protein
MLTGDDKRASGGLGHHLTAAGLLDQAILLAKGSRGGRPEVGERGSGWSPQKALRVAGKAT